MTAQRATKGPRWPYLVSVKNGGLHRGTVSDGLVRVDRLVQLFTVEEVLEQFLDLGDSGAASDQHDVVDARLMENVNI